MATKKIKPIEQVKAGDIANNYHNEDEEVIMTGQLFPLCQRYAHRLNTGIQEFYDRTDANDDETKKQIDETQGIITKDQLGDYSIYFYGDDGAVVYEDEKEETPFGLTIAPVNLSPLFKDNVNELNYHIGLFNQEHEELEDFHSPYQIIRLLEPADLETLYQKLKYAHIQLKVQYMQKLFQEFHEESHDQDKLQFLKDTQSLYDGYFDDMQDLVYKFLFVPFNKPYEHQFSARAMQYNYQY